MRCASGYYENLVFVVSTQIISCDATFHISHPHIRIDRSQEEEVEELAAAVESLRQENNALMERVDTHEQERLEVEENSRRNKEQLHDMSQMASLRMTTS